MKACNCQICTSFCLADTFRLSWLQKLKSKNSFCNFLANMSDKPSKSPQMEVPSEEDDPIVPSPVVAVEQVGVKSSMRQETLQQRRESAAEVLAETGRKGSENIRTTVPGSKKLYSKNLTATDQTFIVEKWSEKIEREWDAKENERLDDQVEVCKQLKLI